MIRSAVPLPPLVQPTVLAEALAAAPAIRLLDVRTPGEFESAHIEGAWNVPLDLLEEHSAELQAGTSDPLVLICQSGGRARKAEEALRAGGMDRLHVLEGGVNGWLASGLPVRRGATRVSLERQVRMVAGGLVALGSLVALVAWPPAMVLPLLVGSGLVFAGATDTCMMGMLLSRLRYNRPPGCDIPAAIRALTRPSA